MNIYDIAKEAGVSIATVSRVLNNKPHVSAKTQKKVQAILNKTEYNPNSIARGLVTNSLGLVGIILVDIRHSHYNTTAYVIERELQDNGFQCLICNSTVTEIGARLKALSALHVDGIFLISSVFVDPQTQEAIEKYMKSKLVVMINGYLPCENVVAIVLDDRAGIGLSVDHLVEKGHKHIVYVNDNDTDSAKRKQEGYLLAMMRHGLQDEINILNTSNSFEGGMAVAEEITAKRGREWPCSAVVFPEDFTALGCIKSLRVSGLRIPEDVAVTGYDNSYFGKITEHTLTSIDSNLDVVGAEAAHIFSECLQGKAHPKQIILTPRLVEGHTT